MNTSDLPNSDVQFSEAPASWNARYITPEGFECQLTLRGESGQEVLEKANGAIAFLQKNNCTPCTFPRKDNHSQSTAVELQQTNGNGNNNNGHDRSWCPIHNCAMRRWEKNGRAWYSHNINGEWCTGKPRRSSNGSTNMGE